MATTTMVRNTHSKGPGKATAARVAAPPAQAPRTSAAGADALPVPTGPAADGDAKPAAAAIDAPRPRRRRKPFVL
jgi:hypothetical protein